MWRRLSITTAALAIMASSPALAAPGDAANGLAAMKTYNVITIGDYETKNHVDGKVLVGGNLTGSGAVFGMNSPVSSAPALQVHGNNSVSSLSINNTKNVFVGGNSAGFNLNGAGQLNLLVGGSYNASGSNINLQSGDLIKVGGQLTANVSGQSGATIQVGGAMSGSLNLNGASGGANLGAPFTTGLAATVSTTRTAITQVGEDVKALSAALGALTLSSNPSIANFTDSAHLTLKANGGSAGFALFNLTLAQLAGLDELKYDFGSTTLPVIVNVSGSGAYTFDWNNLGGSGHKQQVIFNFLGNADILWETDQFSGSILAPTSKVTLNKNNIEGSVAVGNLVQKVGEIHMGAFGSDVPLQPVPEPATWAMMIAGMGIVGGTLRRRAGKTLQTA